MLIAQDVNRVHDSILSKAWHILTSYLPIPAHLDLAAASHTVHMLSHTNCKVFCFRQEL